jgi:WD40 repeat protein
MLRIFISHSGCNNREATALKRWLSSSRPELANEIFLDIDEETGLRLGRRWKEQLLVRNTGCEWLVCLVSRDWIASKECLIEYHLADRTGKNILIARLEDLTDADWRKAGESSGDITSNWQRCDLFRDGPHTDIEVVADPPVVPEGPPVSFNTATLHEIRRLIEGAGIGPEAFVWPPRDDPKRAPYRGWKPFEDIDAAVFFGRDMAIASGLTGLRDMRFPSPDRLPSAGSMFVVLGPSGSGKSSFLRAGLIPRLQRDDQNFAALGVMRASHALTGEQGFIAAVDQGRRALGMTDISLDDIENACLRGDSDGLCQWLTRMRSAAAGRRAEADTTVATPAGDVEDRVGPDVNAPTLVLPLDQAEELFPAAAGTEAARFLELLAKVLRAVNGTDVGLIVVTTIRTDRYEEMQTNRALRGIGAVLFNELKPMPASEHKEVIVGPARRASETTPLTVDDHLVQQLIADAQGADTLPLLALTLDRLYKRYARDGRLTLDQYQRMGGMRDVVNNEIEQILPSDARQREQTLAALREAFIPGLVDINPENNRPLRRPAPESEIPEAATPLIDQLVQKRLLIRDRDERNGQVVVEVALESLFEHWADLKGWLIEQRDDLKTVHDIERTAAGWAAHRTPDWLLTRTRLADAEKLAQSGQFSARLAGAREFLAASRQFEDEKAADELRIARERQAAAEALAAEERAHSRKLRRAVAAIAVVAVVAVVSLVAAVVAGLQARQSRNQAQLDFVQATAERVGADALGILNRDRPGGDVRAIQEMLAATMISPETAGDDAVAAAVKVSWASRVISPGLLSTAAYSADGRRVASGGFDHLVRIWDVSTGAQIGKPFQGHHSRISGVAFSQDGGHLVSASDDGQLRLWNVNTGEQEKCTTTLGSPCPAHSDPSSNDPGILSLALSPDGKRLATADNDNVVLLWNPETLQPVRVLKGHSDTVFSVAFSANGEMLASGSRDNTIQLWKTDTGDKIGDALHGQSDSILSVAFSPDGHRLVSGSYDTSIWVWNAVDTEHPVGAKLSDQENPGAVHTAPISAVAFSPSGGTVMSGAEDGTIRWWDATSGFSIQLPSTRRGDRVQTLAFDPAPYCDPNADCTETGTLGVLSCSSVGGIQLWNNVGEAIPLKAHGKVTVVAFNPKFRNVIASGSNDHHVRIWRPGYDDKPTRDMEDGAGVGWLAFSPDGHRIASASWDGKIYIWDGPGGKPANPGVIDTHTPSVASVVYSADGERIISASGDETAGTWVVQTWNAHTGAPIAPTIAGRGPPLETVAISPDGALIASGGDDDTIRLWDAHNGDPVGQLTGHTESVYEVAFSPDGHHLVSGSWDSTVRVWDVDKHREVRAPDGRTLTLTGHVGRVHVVTYSPDGRYIASSGDDGTIRLWNAQTGRPVGAPLSTGFEKVWAVAFSPEGDELVSGDGDGTLHVWPFPFNAQNRLCEKIAANMSHRHWKEWISPNPSIGYRIQCPGKPIEPDG